MDIPISPQSVREVIVVDDSGVPYDFGSSVEVRTVRDTESFRQLLESHEDSSGIGAVLLSGLFPAEPDAEPTEQWEQALEVLEHFEKGRGGNKIPVTPFSESAAINGRIRDRLEKAGHPVLIENDAMLFSQQERVAGWVGKVVGRSSQ